MNLAIFPQSMPVRRHGANGSGRRRPDWSALGWSCAAGAVCSLLVLAGSAWGDVSKQRSDWLAVEPVASCRLQKVAGGTANSTLMAQNGMLLANSNAGDVTEYYERGPGGDWNVPKMFEGNDPWMRLLLLTTDGPLIIDLAVHVGDRPFRAVREAWIDEAAKQPANQQDPEDATADSKGETTSEPASNDGSSANGSPAADSSDDGSTLDSSSDNESATAEKENEDSAEEVDENDKSQDATDAEEMVPGIAPRVHPSASARTRLARYLKHRDQPVDRVEARWLLSQWVPGPSLMMLRHGFASERADEAPLWCFLDRDQDGVASADEIAGAAASFRQADRNEDDLLDLAELRATTGFSSEHLRGWKPRALLVRLGEDEAALVDLLSEAYELYGSASDADSESRGPFTRLFEKLDISTDPPALAELASRLGEMKADVVLSVQFSPKQDGEAAAVRVLHIADDLGVDKDSVTATDDVVVIPFRRSYLEIAAAQPAGDAGSTNPSGQISVGAAVDGRPLLRRLDANGDGRISQRELRDLENCLASQDQDDNGELESREVQAPIRLAVALGPNVHRMLESPTRAAVRARPRETTAAPAWFSDANGDGDLSRNEFLGTREQFDQIDEDRDGLISVKEAVQADKN